MTTYYYTASSLDGFIATPDHSLDWLLSRSIDEAGPMHYSAFERTIGAIAMGASTYAWLLAHGGREKWPYEQPVWVFTHRALEVPAGADVRAVEGDVVPVHREMTAAAEELGIWVMGGGELAGRFADAGLLDEVWVQFAPVTLGAGSPLLPRALELELVESARNVDFSCVRYRVPSGRAAADRLPG
ncbi:MAG: dihydrofolate reductase family protein [Protaetiibacter sp.]